MSSANCCFLTCIQASQEVGLVVWYSHLFQNFQQFILIQKSKAFAEVDVFLELACFFKDPADVGNLISGSSVFCKTSLNIWELTIDILLKPGLGNFEQYFVSMWGDCNSMVFEHLLALPFFEIGMKTDSFELSHCWDFQISRYNECITSTVSSSRIGNSSTGIKVIIEPPNSPMDTA